MQTYSDFFKTLHDETSPTGHLGRGTHCSVLRAVTFHDARGKPLAEGRLTDFAVIWDEDHDTRVMEPIAEIYRRGLLSSFLMFGEHKGLFTAIRGDFFESERDAFLSTEIEAICQSLSDAWPAQVVSLAWPRNPIIDDEHEKVSLYLNNLKMLWQLGSRSWAPIKADDDDGAEPPLPFNPLLLKKVDELPLTVRTPPLV